LTFTLAIIIAQKAHRNNNFFAPPLAAHPGSRCGIGRRIWLAMPLVFSRNEGNIDVFGEFEYKP